MDNESIQGDQRIANKENLLWEGQEWETRSQKSNN